MRILASYTDVFLQSGQPGTRSLSHTRKQVKLASSKNAESPSRPLKPERTRSRALALKLSCRKTSEKTGVSLIPCFVFLGFASRYAALYFHFLLRLTCDLSALSKYTVVFRTELHRERVLWDVVISVDMSAFDDITMHPYGPR